MRVVASGINPSDIETRRGFGAKAMPFSWIIPHQDGEGVRYRGGIRRLALRAVRQAGRQRVLRGRGVPQSSGDDRAPMPVRRRRRSRQANPRPGWKGRRGQCGDPSCETGGGVGGGDGEPRRAGGRRASGRGRSGHQQVRGGCLLNGEIGGGWPRSRSHRGR